MSVHPSVPNSILHSSNPHHFGLPLPHTRHTCLSRVQWARLHIHPWNLIRLIETRTLPHLVSTTCLTNMSRSSLNAHSNNRIEADKHVVLTTICACLLTRLVNQVSWHITIYVLIIHLEFKINWRESPHPRELDFVHQVLKRGPAPKLSLLFECNF